MQTRLRRLTESGIKTIILETEGSAFPGPDEFSKSVESETLKYTDCYYAWGSIAKDVVTNESPNTRVEVTGNPRFDLLQKPHRKLYENSSKQLNDEYGDFILFNANFSLANGKNTVADLVPVLDKDHPVYLRALNSLKTQMKIFVEFTRLIAETAERFPNRNIILRPHPGEDPTFYENCLYAYENVHIESRLEARPWILAAETVVHNICTTGVTSALLNTPVIAYVPDGLEMSSLPNEVSNRCETVTEVCDTIQEYLDGNKTFAVDSATNSKIRQHIDNIDYLSSERIADVIDSVLSDTTGRTPLRADTKLRLRRTIVRAMGSKRFEELYIKNLRGENRQKHPYTSTAEVNTMVDSFVDDIKPPGLQVSRLPYMVNGFRIRNGQSDHNHT